MLTSSTKCPLRQTKKHSEEKFRLKERVINDQVKFLVCFFAITISKIWIKKVFDLFVFMI